MSQVCVKQIKQNYAHMEFSHNKRFPSQRKVVVLKLTTTIPVQGLEVSVR